MWILDKIISRNKTIKFEEISREWLELKKNSIKQSTYYKYAYCIDKYLKERLGKLKKRELEKFDYNQMTNELKKELSAKSIKEILNILKAILRYANFKYNMDIRLDLIIAPKVRTKEINVLSKKEVRKLEKYCLKENTLKTLGVWICLNTGLRIGEICALKWKNFEFEKRLINIKKTLQRVYTLERKTEVIIDTSKTESSIRAIPMSDKIYQMLKGLAKKQEPEAFFFNRFKRTIYRTKELSKCF